VQDDGPGFAVPAAGAQARARAGTGLGLKIAHEMAARIGGRITASNRPERGALLTLSLPQASWHPTAEPPEATPGLPDLSQMKVLVAEDSEMNQALIGHMLTALGAEVEVAGDGIEALNRLDREAFDAALIDIEMPRLSGIEVMRSIRTGGGRHAGMPIMAVTAYVLRANREAIYAAGADSILAKPLGGLESFGAAMAALLDRTRASEAPPDAPAEACTLDIRRFEALLEIAGPEGRVELLTRLLSDLQSVERGLVLGCSEPDYAMIRSQTHVLIAVAGAVGAERLMTAARALNTAAHQRTAEEVKAIAPEVLALLDDLIHFVSGHVSPRTEAP
jgi:CheY-like chemotaxis protein